MKRTNEVKDYWLHNWFYDEFKNNNKQMEQIIDTYNEFLIDEGLLTEEGKKFSHYFWNKYIKTVKK